MAITPSADRRDTSLEENDPAPGSSLTVYFDGSCPLCTLEISHYAAQPGSESIVFVDASATGANTGEGRSPENAMKRFHVRLPDGRLLSGARAFVAIWQALPRWRWAARLAETPGVTMALEAAYRLFLPVRPFLAGLARRFAVGANAV